ncbi:7-carboxy-7-deazaguanine synthase QueE [uncultured Campylobacter sp.]|uniref:7-carboxy-7-deazaguanine synthase QueE n=1 Tax=uncultured Campylobacter sp. TaxID=218934 RepID=UPI0026127E20|nr:7-carboxy-7-deazaguanine synthase QueE [uncultured Campylobacter sp.]
MQIVEYFLSLQGEGKFAGRLAIFIRLAGCNFNCSGFKVEREKNGKILVGCDTIRAVFTSEFKNEYKKLNKEELLQELKILKKNFSPIVVITGGEPTLWHKNDEFIGLVKELQNLGLELHFESNASIFIDFDKYSFYKDCIFALSVKLSNSGVLRQERLQENTIKNIVKNSKESFYKFVLDEKFIKSGLAKKEIDEVLAIADNEIFCMPMGKDEKELEKNAIEVAKFCIENGYNYSDRLHIRLWGNKEGV